MGFDNHRFDQLIEAVKDVAQAVREQTSYMTDPETTNVATAIREQTQYFVDSDAAEKEEDGVKEEGDKPEPLLLHHVEAEGPPRNIFKQYFGDPGEFPGRRIRQGGTPDFPDDVADFMQEVLHRYTQPRGYLRNEYRRCGICRLKRGNPVHDIQTPAFNSSED